MQAGSSDKGFIYNQVALIGTGLIGGSIGIALREKCLVKEIVGFDQEKQALEEAIKRGAVDRAASSPADAVKASDLVVLAIPVLGTLKLIKEILPFLKKGAVITDVGSTKALIMKEIAGFIPASVHFIGGHPMAGSEESGIKGADPALLENAIYVLTPSSGCPPVIIDRLTQVIKGTGAEPLVLDPEEHDRVVAFVSHLPYIVAAALTRSVAGAENMELVRTLAAGGFRDSTRIALSNPELWRGICLSNREELSKALASFQESIERIQRKLADCDQDAIEEFFREARDYRSNIPYRGRGILPDLYEVIVLIKDAPGAIGHLATLLGKAGVNIDAIEILHIRELAGGSIRLGFRDFEQQQKALKLLAEKGYPSYSK